MNDRTHHRRLAIAGIAVLMSQATLMAVPAAAQESESIWSIGDVSNPNVDDFFERPTTSRATRDTDFVCSTGQPGMWEGTVSPFVIGETPEAHFPGMLRSTDASPSSGYYDWSCQSVDVVFRSTELTSAALTLIRRGGEETEVLLDGVPIGRQSPQPNFDPHPSVTYEIVVGDLSPGQHVVTLRGTQRPADADGYAYFEAMQLTGIRVPASAPDVDVDEMAASVLATSTEVIATVTDSNGLYGATCDVDWGDETEPSTVDVVEGQCTATHVYPAAGNYTVTVTATDATGLTDADSTTVTVYSTDSTVTANGRLSGAVLNVSTRYDKDGNGTGRVSYRETPKGLTVESESVELVLVTSTTARVEGAASVNGTSGHHYVVSFDLDANTVQVVVTDPDGAVVLDSGVQELSKGGVQAKAG